MCFMRPVNSQLRGKRMYINQIQRHRALILVQRWVQKIASIETFSDK